MKKSSLVPLAILMAIILVIVLCWKNYYGFTFEKTVVQEPVVFIDCNRSIKESVKAGGYDYVASDLAELHFLPNEQDCGKKLFKLYHFDEIVEEGQVICEMARDGYRPATLMGLLAFGEANPDLQMRFSIFGLGSWTFVGGFRRAPYLGKFAIMENERTLGLGPIIRFHPRVRFLGVKDAVEGH